MFILNYTIFFFIPFNKKSDIWLAAISATTIDDRLESEEVIESSKNTGNWTTMEVYAVKNKIPEVRVCCCMILAFSTALETGSSWLPF